MPNIVTQTTGLTNGHDGCAPVSPTSASSLLTVNGSGVVCVGDSFAVHSNGESYPPHTGIVTTGSSLVSVDGKPVALVGSVVGSACPSSHVIVKGDDLVNIAS